MKEDFKIEDLNELLHEDNSSNFMNTVEGDIVTEAINYFKDSFKDYDKELSAEAIDTLNNLLSQIDTITEKYLLELYNVYATFFNFLNSTFTQGKDFIVFAKPSNISTVESDFDSMREVITVSTKELNKACDYLNNQRLMELKELDDISDELFEDGEQDAGLFAKYKLLEKSEKEYNHIIFLSNIFKQVLDDCVKELIYDMSEFIELYKQDKGLALKKLVNKIERLCKRTYEASISNLYSDSYIRDFSKLNSGLIDRTKEELFGILNEYSITNYKEYLEYFGEENESIILEKLFLQ